MEGQYLLYTITAIGLLFLLVVIKAPQRKR